MKFIIAFGVICSFLLEINGAEFTDCGSKAGKFTKVEVSNCDATQAVCILKKNTNATISIDFESDNDDVTVTTVVHGVILGIDMPFPISNPNACLDSGVSCPLKKGSVYEYTATFPILKAYPKVKVGVKWELKNEHGDDIICVMIPAKIE